MHICTYDWELDIGRTDFGTKFFNVLNPFVVILQTVGGDTDDFDVTLLEVFSTASDFTQFRGADRCEIARMGEKDNL